MKQRLTLLLSPLTRIVFFLVIVLLMPIRAFAAPPPDPTDTPDLHLNIASEAYVQGLPGAKDSPASSDWFKQQFADLIGSLLSIVMTVAAIMLLLYLVIGAFGWITSAGDKSKLEEARNRITTAIIGMIVLSAVVALFMLVQQILGICVLDFWGNACTVAPGG